jgi:hypothetical protein
LITETDDLLRACFAVVEEPEVETLDERLVAKIKAPMRGQKGEHPADLHIFQRFCLDSTDTYLTVEQSVFKLTASIDRTPILRYDYDRPGRARRSGRRAGQTRLRGHSAA